MANNDNDTFDVLPGKYKPDKEAKEGVESRQRLTAFGVDEKWSKATWDASEVKLSEFDLLVLKCLVLAAKGEHDESTDFKVMGDMLYQQLRSSLNDKVKLLADACSRTSTPTSSASSGKPRNRKGGKRGGNKATKGPSRADIIRMESSIKGLKDKLETSLESFLSKEQEFTRPTLLKESTVELRGVGFLLCAWWLMKNRKDLEETERLLVFSIIVSMERFVKNIEKLQGKSYINPSRTDLVSSTLRDDLVVVLGRLKTEFKFNGQAVYREAPQLLIFSSLDDTLPQTPIKPYPHQTRICEIVKEHINNGFYIMYRAITNAGKTTTLISLAATVQKLREDNPDNANYSKLQILFSCGSNPVKDQAAQWCYNTSNIAAIKQLPFAIAFVCSRRGLVIRNSYSVGEGETPLVVVCSPSVALEVLRRRAFPYILFHDEPTIGAEDTTSKQLNDNVRLMKAAPKWTILSSATLPSEEGLTPFLRSHKARFRNAHTESVYSNSISMGCDVYSLSGKTFLPHGGVKGCDELRACTTNISQNMFLGRMYTPLSVGELAQLAKGHVDVVDIDTHFSKVENLSANQVRLYGLKLLEMLSQQASNTTVGEICSYPIKANSRSLEFETLGTKEAYKLPQMTLIADVDPVEFALEKFKTLIDDVVRSGYTLDRVVSKHYKVLNQWKDEVEGLRKRRTKSTGRRRDEDTEEPDYAQQEMDLLANKPFLSFPETFQVNTIQHLDRYGPGGAFATPRFPLPSVDFIEDNSMNVPPNFKLLLCCGIGIYSPESPVVGDNKYLKEVINLAKKGQLAYFVADHNISYGVNFPFARAIITDKFVEQHSMNTVLQLMSRAGRVGQSWYAECFVSSKVTESLKQYAQENMAPDKDVEVRNMTHLLQQLVHAERAERLARTQ